jgi:hypothetical protein
MTLVNSLKEMLKKGAKGNQYETSLERKAELEKKLAAEKNPAKRILIQKQIKDLGDMDV